VTEEKQKNDKGPYKIRGIGNKWAKSGPGGTASVTVNRWGELATNRKGGDAVAQGVQHKRRRVCGRRRKTKDGRKSTSKVLVSEKRKEAMGKGEKRKQAP